MPRSPVYKAPSEMAEQPRRRRAGEALLKVSKAPSETAEAPRRRRAGEALPDESMRGGLKASSSQESLCMRSDVSPAEEGCGFCENCGSKEAKVAT